MFIVDQRYVKYLTFTFCRDRFLKKKCGNQTVGAPAGLANGGRGAVGAEFEHRRGIVRGGVSVPPPQKKMDLGSQIGEFWCKLTAFCTVHLKLVLYSWERRSHCQNNFGNAVPRRSRWK